MNTKHENKIEHIIDSLSGNVIWLLGIKDVGNSIINNDIHLVKVIEFDTPEDGDSDAFLPVFHLSTACDENTIYDIDCIDSIGDVYVNMDINYPNALFSTINYYKQSKMQLLNFEKLVSLYDSGQDKMLSLNDVLVNYRFRNICEHCQHWFHQNQFRFPSINIQLIDNRYLTFFTHKNRPLFIYGNKPK